MDTCGVKCSHLFLVLVITVSKSVDQDQSSFDAATGLGLHCLQCNKSGHAASSSESSTNHCPPACETCTEDNICVSCPPGKYGTSCEESCLNCNEDVCNMTGYCVLGCKSASYRHVNGEFCLDCFHGCHTCTSNNVCGQCKTGFYGQGCGQDCSLCEHNKCDKFGCKTRCNDGFFTEKVDAKYTKCTKCPSDYCLECQSGEKCDKCGTKFWGSFCENACPDKCLLGCDQDTGACVECSDRQYIDSTGQCKYCPETCLFCKSDKNCQVCVPGYSGTQCEICSLLNCIQCQYNGTVDSTTCRNCVAGRYGEFCDNLCNKECESGDNVVPLCDSLTGTCLHGCVREFWGPFCNQSCGVGCIGGKCNQSSNNCSCANNNYGPSCNSSCFGKCPDPGNGSRICNQEDGTCLFNSEVYVIPGWFDWQFGDKKVELTNYIPLLTVCILLIGSCLIVYFRCLRRCTQYVMRRLLP